MVLLALRPQAQDVVNGFGWNARDAIGVVAAMAFALTAPSFFNLAYSPFRHMNIDTAIYAPILPRGGVHDDLQSLDLRVNRVDIRTALDGVSPSIALYEEREEAPVFLGEPFATCSVELGLPRVIDAVVRDMEDAGLTTGKSLFAADLFSSHWLFGDLEPMDGGAPWYYGGVPGLKDADYVLVPICPVAQDIQIQIFEILDGLVETGKIELTEIRRTDLYILFEKTETS